MADQITLTEAQLDRLPRYAQAEILRLARDLDAAQETIGGIDLGQTDTRWRRMAGGAFIYHGLPDGTAVIFDDTIEARVDHRAGRRRVVVSTTDGALRIRPQSSVVEVGHETL